MRVYPFVLLASTGIPIRITNASRVSDSSMTELNFTASAPPPVDDPYDASAHRLTNAHKATEDEERAPTKSSELLSGPAKTVLFKLYRGASKNLLTKESWHRIMFADEDFLRRVYKQKIKLADLQDENGEISMDLRASIPVYEHSHHVNKIKSKIADITRWMQDKPPELLVRVLKHHFFFRDRDLCVKVEALRHYLKDFNLAHGTQYTVLDTFAIGFHGMDKFASILSIQKQSPFTATQAKYLQDELLSSWRDSGKSIDEVATMIKVRALPWRGITYENLDTFVEYVALYSKKPAEAISWTLTHLRHKLGDVGLVRAIIRGKQAELIPATSYLGHKYEDFSVGPEKEKHEIYAKQFEKELARQWVSEGKTTDHVRECLEKVPVKKGKPYVNILPEDTSDIREEFEALQVLKMIEELSNADHHE